MKKYINYIFLVGAVALCFGGLYYWLGRGQMDYAAFCMALAALSHGVYVHATKVDRPSA